MRVCSLAGGGADATSFRSSHSHTTRACYCLIVDIILLLIVGSTNSLEISTGFPATTNGGTPPASLQVAPSGEHASLDSSSQQLPKPLELLLRTSLAGGDNEVVNTQPSQNGLDTTSQRANTVVVTSPPSTATTTTTTTAAAAAAVAATPIQAIAPTKAAVVSGAQNSQPSTQTKSLKFTLIAGKSWKFTIKGNSLSSHKGTELRLHKNVSTNNYIIDDEGWFQYNPQQQQLFAWPSLNTKSGTYYFVLLPSGIDFEADSENIVNLEVAASIVVELIKPIYQGVKTGDIDLLIDHQFSLEYLHRHSTYPLLLSQIFSVFETLATRSSNNTTSQIVTNSPSLLTTISPNQQVATSRSPNKLGEYLLLNSSYSLDGEIFAITWSTHPALLNNTLIPTSECRVNTITDTISKLSSLSAGAQSDEEKSTILYALETPQTSNSLAIIPTERTHALKLSLLGPCQKAKIIEELGIQQQVGGKVAGVAPSADDNENNVVADKHETSTAAIIKTTNSTANSPNPPGSESLITSTADQINSSESSPLDSTSLQNFKEDLTTISPPQVTGDSSNQPRSISHKSGSPESASEVSPPTSSPPSIETEPPVIKTSNIPLQQPKVQPQAKSLEDFLEMSDMQPSSTPPPSGSSSAVLLLSTQQSNLSTTVSTDSVESTTATIIGGVSVVPTRTVTPVSAESTLNEDFMGILDGVMNYLISVAVPASIIVGTILLLSIIFALCHLYRKRKKSKEFQVRSRFDFRYSSERKGFLKNSSRPVILEADQKSLSMGGTPQHKATMKNKQKIADEERKHYLPMSTMSYEASGSASANRSREANVQEERE